MGEYQTLLHTLALTLGVAWASGINLYAAVAVLGIAGSTGYVQLPDTLSVVEDPLVIVAACLMYCVEFFADKVPGVDSSWDALHTFIRIPAGALLAAGAVGDVTPAAAVAAGLLGGGVAAATHATKAGTRLLINTSPEPFSNFFASLAEDITVFAGLWAALAHPVVFLLLLMLFLLALCWLLPRIWRGVRLLARRIRALFTRRERVPNP
jgi:Domain of unknown function (DUF4126)